MDTVEQNKSHLCCGFKISSDSLMFWKETNHHPYSKIIATFPARKLHPQNFKQKCWLASFRKVRRKKKKKQEMDQILKYQKVDVTVLLNSIPLGIKVGIPKTSLYTTFMIVSNLEKYV